jgi:hypothetical protein
MGRLDYPSMIGEKHNKLTFLGDVEIRKGKTFLKVRCDCGVEKFIDGPGWRNGITKSCGCEMYPKTHYGKHPLYAVWQTMKSRCYKPKACEYHNYGAIGVRVCVEWRYSFVAFFNWAIANGWEKGLQLDKDKKSRDLGLEGKMYSPEWCSFLTPAQNSREKRTMKLTQEMVNAIRMDPRSAAKVSSDYGVSSGHIVQIRNYKKWK